MVTYAKAIEYTRERTRGCSTALKRPDQVPINGCFITSAAYQTRVSTAAQLGGVTKKGGQCMPVVHQCHMRK